MAYFSTIYFTVLLRGDTVKNVMTDRWSVSFDKWGVYDAGYALFLSEKEICKFYC